MNTYDVELRFTEPLLGTVPLDPELYRKWIIDHQGLDAEALADELESAALGFEGVNEETEKGTTGFHRLEDGTPILYDYVIKGFFKDACGMLRRDGDSSSAKLSAYRKVIDGMVFVEPRRIPIAVCYDEGLMAAYDMAPGWQRVGEEGVITRPLRAQTAQGERVALARSITVPAGSSLAFSVLVLGGVTKALLDEWFSYGRLRGLGQWRNGAFGRFTYTLTKR